MTLTDKEEVVNRLLGSRIKKKFYINIWDFLNLEDINNELDKVIEKDNYVASDINYKCLKISKDGVIYMEADYVPEEYWVLEE